MADKTKIKFTDIIQMISDGNVPEGAVFIADDGCRAVMTKDIFSVPSLIWENSISGDLPNRVQLSSKIINGTWYMEVTEEQLTLAEAIEEWRKGNRVKVAVRDHEPEFISPYTDFDDIWEDTELTDLDDLFFRSRFYKVIC